MRSGRIGGAGRASRSSRTARPIFQFVTTDTGSHNRTYDYREEFPDTTPSQAGDYYYLRIQQCDGALAWSSPIWIDL